MRFRDGIGFGIKIAAAAAVGQVVVALINPPDDWPGYVAVAVMITAIAFLVGVLADARRKARRRDDRA